MKPAKPTSPPAFVFYLLPLLLLAAYRLLLPGYLCDDAYISLQTAAHLAQGQGFGFNAGEAVYVTTSPLWVVLLAGARVITGDVVTAASILGFLFEAGTLLLMVRLGEEITGKKIIGTTGAVLLCVNPVFIITSGSGMEVSLYLCTILLSLLFLLKRDYIHGLIVAAAAVWVRIDGVLLLAAAILWTLFDLWRQARQPEWKAAENRRLTVPKLLIPLSILGGYVLFGLLLFDTAIPTSVQRKGMTSSSPLSGEWLLGAWRTGREFLKVVIGRSGYWITGLSPLILTVPFLLYGGWKAFAERNRKMVPLILFTLIYIAGFVGSGSEYARHFPWYFVPILPTVALLTAFGFERSFRGLITSRPGLHRWGVPLSLFLLLLWGGVNFPAIHHSQELLLAGGDGPGERERVYGAGAVWIGRYLPEDAVVAGNEIGALGFFLPSNIHVLDMYGILRRPEDLERSWIDMVRERRPEAVLVRENFENREEIEREMPGEYRWHRFRTLDIGLRTDLAPAIESHLDELPEIYDTLNLHAEPTPR